MTVDFHSPLASASTGLIVRAIIQACSLILITRLFVASDYGAISVLIALSMMLAPISTLGMDTVLVRETALNWQNFRVAWGRALATSVVCGLSLTAVLSMIAQAVLPDSVGLAAIVFVALSDLVFGRLIDCCSRAYLAHNQGSAAAWIPNSAPLLRLCGLLVLFLAATEVSITHWASVYFLTTMIAAAFQVARTSRKFGRPTFNLNGWKGAFASGRLFAFDQAAERARIDIDKVLLLSFAGASVAGWFALAYRCLSLAVIPINALLFVTYHRFFQEGQESLLAARAYCRKILIRSVAPVTLLALIVAMSSPLLPVIFGPGYSESVPILAILVLLLPLLLIRQLLANALVGAGLERYRFFGSSWALLLNLLMNLLLIPIFGWKGAVLSAISAEIFLSVFYLRYLNTPMNPEIVRSDHTVERRHVVD